MTNTEILLSPLPYPVYFVIKDTERWKDVLNAEMPPSVNKVYDRIKSGSDSWTVQTYIQLKRLGLDVHLIDHFPKGKICIVSYDDLLIRDFSFDSYVVCIRHDRPRPRICEQSLVQNHLNIFSKKDHFIKFWPQPGLIPRDLTRGNAVNNLCYKGLHIYLAWPFRTNEFLDELKKMSVSYDLDKNWHDYSHDDLVIAVRNCTEYDLSIKPASKLINAWKAGCPALLGPESAYQAWKRSDLDYIEIKSPEEALAAIAELKNNPELFKKMVENGFQRAKEFDVNTISKDWLDLLADPIAKGYEKWKHQSRLIKYLKFPFRCVLHKWERRKYFKNILNGPRLFEDKCI